ncbi:phage small terminase subunit GpM, partial [Escherichia coli E1167]
MGERRAGARAKVHRMTILMTVMLWRLDTGDIAGALEIARYALKYGLTMPGKHRRTPPYMF